MPRGLASILALLLLAAPPSAMSQEAGPSKLIPAGTASDLPVVEPNDNTRIAGALEDGTRKVELEVDRADWRVEGPDGPGLRVAAIGEAGGTPSVPAPLLRVDTDTRLAVTVRNRLPAPVTVFGLHARPSAEADSFVVAPGSAETVEFERARMPSRTPGYRTARAPAHQPATPSLDRPIAGSFDPEDSVTLFTGDNIDEGSALPKTAGLFGVPNYEGCQLLDAKRMQEVFPLLVIRGVCVSVTPPTQIGPGDSEHPFRISEEFPCHGPVET